MRRVADSLWREIRAAGPGEWLAGALLVSAFYLEPIAGNAPWSAALVLTCLIGGAFVIWRPGNVRRIPLILALYVLAYALSGALAGHGGGSDVARYIVRPVALVSLTLLLTTPASRRRAMVMLIALAVPQVAATAWQAVAARIDFGTSAARAADSVDGTFGAYGGGSLGLVAAAVMCLTAGLVLAGVLDRRRAAGLVVLMVAIEAFTATRAAIVFVPAAGIALVAGAAIALGRRASARQLAVVLGMAVLTVPVTYVATTAVYPGSFVGVFSNQEAHFLGNGPPTGAPAPSRSGQPGDPYVGPRGVAVLPGRATQIKNSVRISAEDGPRVLLLGRGYGTAAVIDDATAETYIPKQHAVGVTWIGKILTETGWLGVVAFLALLAWLAWLGIRIVRGPATGYDRVLGFALPGLAVLTLAGAAYTTVLDVRPYSAAFIVLAAAGFAAARDAGAGASIGAEGNGRLARPSTPLPPRQHATSSPPSA